MIQEERIRRLNERAEDPAGRHVLYWMQQSQRARGNHALEYAVREANRLELPLVVGFGLTPDYPEANERHFAFLLEGLLETKRTLKARGIGFVLRRGAPDTVAAELAHGAALAVTDRGYLRVQREWRARAAQAMSVPLVEVESDVIVPVDTASNHEEFAARTLRPKIGRLLERYLVPLAETPVRRPCRRPPPGDAFDTVESTLAGLTIDRSVGRVADFPGGATAAARRLADFLARKLPDYAAGRSDPDRDCAAGLSAHLHFGQISALDIALQARASGAPRAAVDVFLEELIVRRELSMNSAQFNLAYARYDAALPDWARRTLAAHAADRRDFVYTPEDWEAARTHDRYWNAAQTELVRSGRMQNYLRMYWGKKILEWSATPREAFETALRLNNKYALDGRDANSFAGVAWCFGKHDRPWAERPVFGMVRYMNAAGLERKFDLGGYLTRWADKPAAE